MKVSSDEKIFFAVVLFIAGWIVSLNMNCDHCCREIPETSYTHEQVTYSAPDAVGIPNNSREMRSRAIRVQNSHTTARKREQWVRDTSPSSSNPIKVYVYQDGTMGLYPGAYPTAGAAVGRTGFNPGVKIGF